MNRPAVFLYQVSRCFVTYLDFRLINPGPWTVIQELFFPSFSRTTYFFRQGAYSDFLHSYELIFQIFSTFKYIFQYILRYLSTVSLQIPELELHFHLRSFQTLVKSLIQSRHLISISECSLRCYVMYYECSMNCHLFAKVRLTPFTILHVCSSFQILKSCPLNIIIPKFAQWFFILPLFLAF
jgi:hypothetical protein